MVFMYILLDIDFSLGKLALNQNTYCKFQISLKNLLWKQLKSKRIKILNKQSKFDKNNMLIINNKQVYFAINNLNTPSFLNWIINVG